MGREATHVGADLCQEILGNAPADPRDLLKPFDHALKRGQATSDLRAETLDSGFELLDVRELLLE